MKPINWNTTKNIRLKAERGVSFEEVLSAISHGAVMDVLDHPNTEQYANQRIFVVRIRGYAYMVPFVETDPESGNITQLSCLCKPTENFLPLQDGRSHL